MLDWWSSKIFRKTEILIDRRDGEKDLGRGGREGKKTLTASPCLSVGQLLANHCEGGNGMRLGSGREVTKRESGK